MSGAADLLVIGGGPSGAAAAITARLQGLRTIIVETAEGPDAGPGETLHPGVAAIFRELGVAESMEAASLLRPQAMQVTWGGERRRSAYGQDTDGPWRGYQIQRAKLNRILLDRFEALGGTVLRSVGPVQPIVEDGRVTGLGLAEGELRAPFTIDATGRAGRLRRALGIGEHRVSPPLLAYFGYSEGFAGHEPMMDGTAEGWSWIAQITPDLIAWVKVDFDARRRPMVPPERLCKLPAIGRVGACDVTWRIARTTAGEGFFLVGDAALVLDPTSSHGVLRAMMSGMMAAHNAAQMLSGTATAASAASAYQRWMSTWFERDVEAMIELYSTLGAPWPRSRSDSNTVSTEG